MGRKFPFFLFGNVTPQFPIVANITAIFDYSKPAQVSPGTDNTAIDSITDTVQNIVWSGTTHKPTYHLTGGPNNSAYAQFVNAVVSGALPHSGAECSLIEIRQLKSSGLQSALYLGSSGDGEGFADYVNVNSDLNVPGGYQNNVTAIASSGSVSVQNVWEFYCYTHSAGVTKLYNISGFSLPLTPNNSNPGAPTVQGQMGNIPGQGNATMNILFGLTANRAFTLSEVNQFAAYFHSAFGLPYATNFLTTGDGIVTGADIQFPFPLRTIESLMATKYCHWNNSAFDGATAQAILDTFSTAILAKFISGKKNVFFVLVGHVDIAESIPAATIYANIGNMVNQIHSAGGTSVVGVPLLSSNEIDNPAMMTIYNQLAALIKGNTAGSDLVWDTTAIPEAQDPDSTTYYLDRIHPTELLASILGVNLATLVSPLF